MIWLHDGPTAVRSEDGRYLINRAPQFGGPITYTLVETGKPWPPRRGELPGAPIRGWDGSRIVGVEREVPDTVEARAAAVRRLRDMVEVA